MECDRFAWNLEISTFRMLVQTNVYHLSLHDLGMIGSFFRDEAMEHETLSRHAELEHLNLNSILVIFSIFKKNLMVRVLTSQANRI